MPWPRRGSLTSVAICSGARDRPANRGEHVIRVRDDPLLHRGRERERRELRADALDRASSQSKLHAGSPQRARSRSLHASRPRAQLRSAWSCARTRRSSPRRAGGASWVDDLHGDAVLLGLLGSLERFVDEPSGRDDGDVSALAVDPCLAERNRLELLGHLALDRTACGARRRRRVVVVDRRPGARGRPPASTRTTLSPGTWTNHASSCCACCAPGDQPAPPCVRIVSGTLTWPPDIVRCFAAWFTSCSIEIVRKSSYMISTIGRMPWIAAPIPLPTIAISEIGVFLTRPARTRRAAPGSLPSSHPSRRCPRP